MSKNCQIKKLGEVIELAYGKGISKTERHEDGQYVVYGANGELGRTDKFLVEGEGIIVGRKGSVGKLHRVSDRFWPSDVTYYIFGNDKVDIDYLFYFLKSQRLQRFAAGVKPGLNRNRVYELEIPLPPLEEQKKIVKVIEEKLGKVREATQLRQDVIADTEKILSAKLSEIFTEGKEKGWVEKRIDDISLQVKSGFACGKQNEVNDGIVHLRTHNISLSGDINLDKIIKIPKEFVDTSIFTLEKDDIVFNNTNSAELVGKTIYVRENLPYAFSNHLTRIRFNKELVLPKWILYVFQKYWSDKVFERMCSRWIGQAGINQTTLKNITVILPDLKTQEKIVKELDELSARVAELRALQDEQLTDLISLERAYLHEAFNGELV